eukprot:1189647-Prorocentrum_minimum.AAC.2
MGSVVLGFENSGDSATWAADVNLTAALEFDPTNQTIPPPPGRPAPPPGAPPSEPTLAVVASSLRQLAANGTLDAAVGALFKGASYSSFSLVRA